MHNKSLKNHKNANSTDLKPKSAGNPTKFNLWKRIRKPPNVCSGSSTQQMTMIFGYVVYDGMLGSW